VARSTPTQRPSRRDLRVVAEGSFSALVRILDGRVSAEGTAPYLARLRGITEAALRSMAETKGWEIEDAKPRRSVTGVTASMDDHQTEE
jgi:hypothetical protein